MNSRTSLDKSSHATGLALAVIFLAGAILDIIYILLVHDFDVVRALTHPYTILCFIMAVGLYLSSRIPKLVWLQPFVFAFGSPLAIFDDPGSIYGAGFLSMATLLMFRLGYFRKKAALKFTGLILFFFTCEILGATIGRRSLVTGVMPVFFVTVFLLLLYFSYEEKLMVYLKEPKPRLSLTDKGFTPLETAYVFAIIEGKSAKEIAYEMKVTESTARNNISRAFHKLGLSDRHEFTILSMKYEIVA